MKQNSNSHTNGSKISRTHELRDVPPSPQPSPKGRGGWLSLIALSASVALFAACGAQFGSPGVTPGGAKDMAQARSVIQAGGVPDPNAITVEGFISEHDVALEEPDEPLPLYAAAALAWNQDFDEITPLITVQIGFGTTLSLDDFEREPLNVGLVIDISGSMADPIDDRTAASKLDAVLIAVDRVLAQMNGRDLVSVVVFDERPITLIEGVRGDEALSVKRTLEGIRPDGDTDIARALEHSYELVRQFRSNARSDRLLVFTDANVTVGTTESEDFIRIMEVYADDDIGATIFGVGVDFGNELAFDISQVRGGNLVYLSDYDRIVQVFGEEFDALVTPIATDVILSTSVPLELDVVDIYGAPESNEPFTHTVNIELPTLFLSTRQSGGAVFIRLRPGAFVSFSREIEVGTLSVSYRDSSGERQFDSIGLQLPAGLDEDAEPPFFENDDVHRGVLLLNTALTMKRAAEDAYGGSIEREPLFVGFLDPEGVDRAIARLLEFLPYFDDLAAGLSDRRTTQSRRLSQERTLLVKLLENLR